MDEVRLIKKYPNRRLYDTKTSTYITLEDVKHLVLNFIPVKIVDAKTEEDLTNSALLQIIMEQEEKGTPILTTEILQNIIRFYGNSMQHWMSQFLEQNLAIFMQQQKFHEKNLKNFSGVDPLSFWKDLQDEWSSSAFKNTQKKSNEQF